MVLRFLFIASLFLLGCGELDFNNPNDPYNISLPSGISYKSFTDSRDGKTYKSVEIGTQTWMAENLNYKASGSYCIGNVEHDGSIYDTLVSNGGYCNIYGRLYDWKTAKTACPSGWHLPSKAEITALKAANSPDKYGFSVLPTSWWSSKEDDGDCAYIWNADGFWQYCKGKSENYYVRCVKDGLCGSQTFNQGTQFCDNNTIYNLCNEKTYTPATQRCGTGNIVEAKCGNLWIDAENQRCIANNGVETKCGSDWFDASNTNLRCQSNVLETKCGATGWYNPKNSSFRCENGVVENNCVDGGDNWYDVSNANLRCRQVSTSSACSAYYGCTYTYAFEIKCGSSWYSAKTYKCGDSNALEYKCGTGWYNPSTQFCDNNNPYDKCGYSTYNPATQRCATGNVLETKCGTNWYDATKTTSLRCQNNVVGIKCAAVWHDVEAYSAEKYRCGTGNVLETKCGTNWYDANDANLRCENNVVETKCGAVWYKDYETRYCSDGTLKSYGTLFDSRDEKTYKTVDIGTQTWMAENLNYAAEGRCYDDKESNCDIYGRLYPSGDYCPSGWHLPSKDEWETLINSVGGATDAGTKLKARTGWKDIYGEISVNKDSYGFAALPGGNYDYSSSYGLGTHTFSGIGLYGSWWAKYNTDGYSSTISMASNLEDAKIYTGIGGGCSGGSYGTCNWSYSSIRCVKGSQEEN